MAKWKVNTNVYSDHEGLNYNSIQKESIIVNEQANSIDTVLDQVRKVCVDRITFHKGTDRYDPDTFEIIGRSGHDLEDFKDMFKLAMKRNPTAKEKSSSRYSNMEHIWHRLESNWDMIRNEYENGQMEDAQNSANIFKQKIKLFIAT